MLVRVLRFGDVEQIRENEIHYFHLRISCRNVNGFPNVSNVTKNLVEFQCLEKFTTLLENTTRSTEELNVKPVSLYLISINTTYPHSCVVSDSEIISYQDGLVQLSKGNNFSAQIFHLNLSTLCQSPFGTD